MLVLVYDWLYGLVKLVAREYAVDTPHWSQLIFPIFLSVVFILSRKICERHFRKLATLFNLRSPRRQKPQRYEVLDSASKAAEDIVCYNFQLWTGLQIKFSDAERTRTRKFCRAGWFFTYYTQLLMLAYSTLEEEPWLWDTRLWWYNYPYQVVTTDCWLYYMISIAFSWSVIQSELKMPLELSSTLLSHLCIVVFMSISWINGFYRVTTVLMYVEDFSNALEETMKLIYYLNCRIIYKMFLPVYIVVWIQTHLVFFQYWILNSVYAEAPDTLEDSTLHYIYGPLFIYMLAMRYYTAVLLLKGLCH